MAWDRSRNKGENKCCGNGKTNHRTLFHDHPPYHDPYHDISMEYLLPGIQ